MKHKDRNSAAAALTCLLALVTLPAHLLASERGNPSKLAQQDSIEVVGHLALNGASISAIATSTHWRHNFLELNDDAHKTLTVVDVTDPAHPGLVRKLTVPSGVAEPIVEAMVGNTGLVGDSGRMEPVAPKSLSIVDFSDPSHPVTQRRFENVTALKHLPGGLICLVDSAGLWILKEHSAPDKALEAAYGNYLLYGLH